MRGRPKEIETEGSVAEGAKIVLTRAGSFQTAALQGSDPSVAPPGEKLIFFKSLPTVSVPSPISGPTFTLSVTSMPGTTVM